MVVVVDERVVGGVVDVDVVDVVVIGAAKHTPPEHPAGQSITLL